ncbi:MAG: hypothetical protein D6826_01915 [Alphaproteobacteria bacterium]|nr:MAG: hypothetical protein D6826_01915 [Alphaproteobacteria bacterium]
MDAKPVRRSTAIFARMAMVASMALFILLGLPGSATVALAAVSAQEAADRIAAEFEVEVLRTRPGEIDGRSVWLVTVMVPGGDSNAAFMVTTLAVDRETGRLIPAFRHGPHGATPPGGTTDLRIERRPDILRPGLRH